MSTDAGSQARLPQVAAKFLLLSISLLFCVAILELALRVLAAGAPEILPITHVADPELQSLPVISGMIAMKQPNQRATFKGRLFRTNSDGIRGPEYTIPKPKTFFRTLVIGDSFTMGSGVSEEETYSARLEARLDADDAEREHEVINLGVGGYNLAASVSRLRRRGLKHEPDLIVYGWTHNDIEGPDYRKTSSPRAPSVSNLLVEAFARERFDSLRDLISPGPDSYVTELDENYFRNEAAWNLFIKGLDDLAAIVREQQICGVVLLHTGLYYSLHALHPLKKFYDAVEKAVLERGLYVAPSFEYHRGKSPESLWIHPTDSHPNAVGHQILADVLYDRLQELPEKCLESRKRGG
jgi:lysophospholipase L1-like esterase